MFNALAKLQTGGHQPNASFRKHFFKGVFYSEDLCPPAFTGLLELRGGPFLPRSQFLPGTGSDKPHL